MVFSTNFLKKNMIKMKYFTQKELKKLFNVIEKKKSNPYRLRNSCMFNIGYLCGLRVSEIGKLKFDFFNEKQGELFCPRLKNSVSNTVRLDDKRKNLLKRYIREYDIKDGYLFVSRKKNPVSSRLLDKLMKDYGRIAKLPKDKIHWHTLKHSIAVHLAESGADVKELQNYLGHRKIDSTMVYFNFTTKQQESFYKKIKIDSQIV
jgi:site-specific recombinase XerD